MPPADGRHGSESSGTALGQDGGRRGDEKWEFPWDLT